jgi:hypothetical protein
MTESTESILKQMIDQWDRQDNDEYLDFEAYIYPVPESSDLHEFRFRITFDRSEAEPKAFATVDVQNGHGTPFGEYHQELSIERAEQLLTLGPDIAFKTLFPKLVRP